MTTGESNGAKEGGEVRGAIELTDDLIDAHLNLAYASSGLNGGMCGEQWDRIVARRFFGLGAAVASGLIPRTAGGKVEAPSSTRTSGPAHNGHPMRHWDRTCPACNPGVRACDPAQLIREWVRLKRAMDKAPNQAAYEQAEVEWQAVNRKFIDYADGVKGSLNG